LPLLVEFVALIVLLFNLIVNRMFLMFFMICFRPGLLNPAVAAAKGKDTVMEIVGETCVVLDFGVLLFVRLLFLQAVKNLIVIDC